jgi:dihydroorotate dehydrogenase (NAD+) catalytic subunit
MAFGTDATSLDELVYQAKELAIRPIIVTLSPNVTSIPTMARCAEKAGADALSLVNTFVALSIDIETRRPRIANTTGGLSGPAIKPIALRMVWEAAKSVKIPILGMGGIVTPEDAAEFLIAGATAVQVGTATYADPRAVERIAKGLEHWCTRHHIEQIKDIIGTLDTSPRPQG